jgi:single-strand DNA-binding protein
MVRRTGFPDVHLSAERRELVMSEHNIVFLRGTVAGEPRSRDLPSGSVVIQYEVTTRDEAGTASVPVAWFDPPKVAVERHRAGDEVVVVGAVRRRFFRSGGVTQSRTEVVAERVLAARQRREIERALAEVRQSLEPA